MGMLIDGKWTDQNQSTSADGKFVRKQSSFRDFIGSKRFPAEANRYHLYISHACPWAHRAVVFRKLKGLESIISLSVVNSFMGENGWELGEGSDPINGKKYMHEIYTLADPSYTGRVSVPVLWDKQEGTIVNNESSEIMRMFGSEFDAITKNSKDYYPENLRAEIDEVNEFVYENINNGVYKTGFATAQLVYETEVAKLFAALDVLEKRLSQHRYLVGNVLTEADWRLFTTLLRFDLVYFGHFKCNIRRIADYPNLSNHLRDLYQTDGVSDTVNIEHIKTHYYTSHIAINPMGIVPAGPEFNCSTPHDRKRFG
ncbi:MAG: glutathione-dependent reductase [Rickettsiales bacterium]|nr:MAG: glutathione-dependent reductase [Rickettsiales bacterium]